MAWLRLYDDLLNNPKVQLLSDDLFRAYINLLCVARLENAGGVLPSDESIAFHLRVTDVSRVTSRVTALIESRLIDEKGGIREVHDWKERQYESDKDPTAKERKRRQRDRITQPIVSEITESNQIDPIVTRDSFVTVTRDTSEPVTDVSRLSEQNQNRTEQIQSDENEDPCEQLVDNLKPNPLGTILKKLSSRTIHK